MSFSRFITDRWIEFFWFFALSYRSVTAENWVKQILPNSCFRGFLSQKGLKNGPRMGIFKFYEKWKDDIVLIFAWRYTSIKAWNSFWKIVVFFGIILFVFLAVTIIVNLKLKLFFLVLNSLSYILKQPLQWYKIIMEKLIVLCNRFLALTHLFLMQTFCTPWKHQETIKFSGVFKS